MKQTIGCYTWGSHSSDYEEYYLLDVMLFSLVEFTNILDK
jgi:hypothetical protein